MNRKRATRLGVLVGGLAALWSAAAAPPISLGNLLPLLRDLLEALLP